MKKEEILKRKQIRIKEYDYSQEGYYFITICTKNRKQRLSKIINEEEQNLYDNLKTNGKIITNNVGVGVLDDPKSKTNTKLIANVVGVGVLDDPKETNKNQIIKPVGVAPQGDPKKEKIHVQLLPTGKIIKKYLENYNKNFENIKINDYVIMPNHIHFVVELIYENGSPRGATPTIPKIINSIKSIVSKEIGYSIWQRNYYEHVIRNEKEYYKILEYIEINPLKWEDDIYYKEGKF